MNKARIFRTAAGAVFASLTIAIAVSVVVRFNEVDSTKPTKPLDNMTYSEAVFYTKAFEDGYKTCLLEIINYVVTTNRTANELMQCLIEKAEEVK